MRKIVGGKKPINGLPVGKRWRQKKLINRLSVGKMLTTICKIYHYRFRYAVHRIVTEFSSLASSFCTGKQQLSE